MSSKMKIRLVVVYSFSLVLHVLVFWGFLFYAGPELEKNDTFASQIEFEVVQSIADTQTQQHFAKKTTTDRTSNRKVSLFPRLIDKTDLLNRVSRNSEFGNGSSTIRGIYDERFFDDNIEDVFGKNQNQNWEFYRAIYQSIDSHLVFDSILAQMKHFGRVRVQFSVSKNGVINFNSVKVVSSDPILKVHTLRAIQKALSTPFKENKYLQTEESEIIFTEFNYKFENPDSNFIKQKSFGSNKFVFNRATLEKPIPEELLEHLLNGGVTPNISLMLERWQKYNRKKEWTKFQFDPFIQYKNDPFYNL